jgi:hypothetical protein
MEPEQSLRFHSLRINNVLFNAFMGGDGPRLEALIDRYRKPQWMSLGSIAKICADAHGDWYICKRDLLERKIALSGFGREDVVALADAFGITIQSFDTTGDRERNFTQSEAWEGLKVWVAENGERAASWADHDLHIQGWHEQALAENSHGPTYPNGSAAHDPSYPCKI